MAITRRAHHQNTHRLRSGRVVASPFTTNHTQQNQTVRRSISRKGALDTDNQPVNSMESRTQTQHTTPSKTTANDNIVDHRPRDIENSLIPQGSPTTETDNAGLMASTATPFSPDFHDNLAIGLPVDGQWDHDDVFAQRFCYQHGETEYLLSTPDRWMAIGDFERADAGEQLQARLDAHEQYPHPTLKHQNHYAECVGTLWSHIDSVVDKRQTESGVSYRVRWKLCWTPSSYIDDLSWVES